MSNTQEKLLRELRQRLDDEQAERQELLAELRRRREHDDAPVMRGVRGIDFAAREDAVRDEEQRAGGLDRHERREVLNRRPERGEDR